jgi:hypothetical protein
MTKNKNKAAQELALLSNLRQTEARRAASRENGKKGGRPRKTDKTKKENRKK